MSLTVGFWDEVMAGMGAELALFCTANKVPPIHAEKYVHREKGSVPIHLDVTGEGAAVFVGISSHFST